MTEKEPTTGTVLPEHEQDLLDTALRESDQLLARSLHDDEARRKRKRLVWLFALVIGGVAMIVLLLAFVFSWLTFGEVNVAEAAKKKVTRAEIEQAEVFTAEGWQLWQKRQMLDAAGKFELAVELNPTAANAWNGLGWALFNSGQSEKGLRAFQRCVKLAPKHPAGLNGLGQVYLSRGEYKQAERYLKQAAPRAPAAWWGLTRLYLLTGEFKKALPWAKKTVKASPEDEVAKQMLAAAEAGGLSDELRQTLEPVTAGKTATEPKQESRPAEAETGSTSGSTDEAWRKRLLAVSENDRWSVGAQIGMELVQIPSDRPYKILATNWPKIATSARKQILKGFTPGMMGNKKVHARFFDVMHLGMTDPDADVRSYAAAYIKMQGLPDFEHDAQGYARWREQNKDRTATEIIANGAKVESEK